MPVRKLWSTVWECFSTQHKKIAKHTARDARLLNGPPKKKKKGNNNNGKKLKSIKSACRIISDSESCDDDSIQCFTNPCLIKTDLNVEILYGFVAIRVMNGCMLFVCLSEKNQQKI